MGRTARKKTGKIEDFDHIARSNGGTYASEQAKETLKDRKPFRVPAGYKKVSEWKKCVNTDCANNTGKPCEAVGCCDGICKN